MPNEFMVLPPDTMVVAIFRLFSYAMHLIKACGLQPEDSGTGFKRGWGVLHLSLKISEGGQHIVAPC